MSTEKLSELSKPVAYDYQIADACIADGHNENGKWVDWNNKLSRYCPPDWMVEEGKVTGLKPLYSQEYVSALLEKSKEKDERAIACVNAFEGIETYRIAGKSLGEFLAGELYLNKAEPKQDGSFGFTFSGLAVQLMADCFADQFKSSGAINYLELLFEHAEVGEMTVTMQRVEGLTPAQKLAAAEQRIAELESIRADASQVFKEIGNELGCNPDNESIMMAIDDLKNDNTSLRDQRAGLAREANELEARAKVWESAATKHLARAKEAEKRLATPVRLPALLHPESDAVNGMIFANGRNEAIAECSVAIRQAGFLSEASPMTVAGDE